MHIKQSHITKKYALLTLLFFVSIMGTIVSVVANDSTVDTRANTIFEAIKSNAKQMNPSDVSAYYSLVRMNIATLMQVLTQVDQKLAQELDSLSRIEPPKTPIAPLPENPKTPIAPLPENPKEPIAPIKNEPTPVPGEIIQGMYRLTQKTYAGDFMKSGDVCANEYGNEWSISKDTIDAHIMTTKSESAWLNVNTAACSNYSSTSGSNGMGYKSNQTTKNLPCNTQMKVACHKSPAVKKENYQEILTPATKSERADFMKKIELELSSKITADSNFVYLNNYLAISKGEFTGMQLYKNPDLQICPSGYSLAQYEYDGHTNNIASPYTMQVLGQYLSNNPSAYSFLEQKEEGNRFAHDYRFWIKQDSFVDRYMTKFTDQEIADRGYDVSMRAYQIRMHNAYLNMNLVPTDKTYYIDNVFGTSDKVLEKRPTLCQKTGAKDNFSLTPGNIHSYDDEIIMNQGSQEADKYIMYAYQRVWSNYSGGGDDLYQYFLPIHRDGGYYFYKKSKQ